MPQRNSTKQEETSKKSLKSNKNLKRNIRKEKEIAEKIKNQKVTDAYLKQQENFQKEIDQILTDTKKEAKLQVELEIKKNRCK